jgi:predicted ABC-type exoprotein transport system permease subunit
MTDLRRNKTIQYLLEIAKWLLVVWLLYPLRQRMHLPVDFARSALGILLFVIFAGKTLYDNLIWKQLTGASRDSARDLLSMVAIVFIIGLLVAATILFIGLYVANLSRGDMKMEPEM